MLENPTTISGSGYQFPIEIPPKHWFTELLKYLGILPLLSSPD